MEIEYLSRHVEEVHEEELHNHPTRAVECIVLEPKSKMRTYHRSRLMVSAQRQLRVMHCIWRIRTAQNTVFQQNRLTFFAPQLQPLVFGKQEPHAIYSWLEHRADLMQARSLPTVTLVVSGS
jgi:hypothetical protein